jgi:uncharacterized RDD family membrane protein YckC
MRSRLQIETPERILFSLPLAGPVSRFLAWCIDVILVIAVSSALSLALAPFIVVSIDLAMALQVLGFFVLSVGYGMSLEWFWRGQTLGKRVLQLRVVDEAGLALQPSQVVIRNLLRAVDALPFLYLLGGAAMLLSRNGQRLGDYAASTVVVHVREEQLPDLEPLRGVKYNTIRDYPHLAARLAQRLSPEEASLGLRALQRRNELSPEARVRLFRELAGHYRTRLQLPDAAVEHLADEQYVRNVIDIVFRPVKP